MFKDLPFKSNPHLILRKRSRLCSTTYIISLIRVTTKLTYFVSHTDQHIMFVLTKQLDDKIHTEEVCTFNCGLLMLTYDLII